MNRLVLGVVGHVDHGKTALVRALTGMETDRLPEEKRRGVSIALGFAHAEIGGTVDFVDAPGHERFIRTMVAGVTGADAALLVVDAREGVRAQTREHLTVAALLGLREVLVCVSKADLATSEEVAQAGEGAIKLAAELGLAAEGPVAVSALSGQGLDELRQTIGGLVLRKPEPPDDGFAYLPLDRAFLIAGQGVVATGTLRRGTLTPGDPVEIMPTGKAVRVRGLQVHGAPVGRADPGQRVAVNLRGVDLDEVPRGTVLASAGALSPAEWLTVELRAAPDAPSLANGARRDLLIGASVVPAVVRLLDRDALAAGETCLAQLRLHAPLSAPAGDGFVLRAASPSATVAGGRVLDPATGRLRRREPARLARLEALAGADPAGKLRLVLEDAGARGVALSRLALLAGLSTARVEAAFDELQAVRLKGGLVIPRIALGRVQAQLLRELAVAGGPVGRQALADRLPRAAPEVVDAVLGALAVGGRVRVDGGRVALVRPDQARAEAEAGQALARALTDHYRAGGLSPAEPAQARTPLGRRVLDVLAREGVLVRTWDRVQKREVVFHREAVEAARRMLAPRLASPGLTVSEAGQALGISRKFSVPLLEHLDGVHFTRRVGDRRILAAEGLSVSSTGRGGD